MNKYRNQRVKYNGMTFDSRKEFARWNELDLAQKAGTISNLRRQVKYEIVPGNSLFRPVHYIADIVYEDDGGLTVVEDVKGYRFGVAYNFFKLKQKLMYERHKILVLEV